MSSSGKPLVDTYGRIPLTENLKSTESLNVYKRTNVISVWCLVWAGGQWGTFPEALASYTQVTLCH